MLTAKILKLSVYRLIGCFLWRLKYCSSRSSLNIDFSFRAPVLVALALIECGMKYEDAVQFIRQ